jgi:hypothetical protein
MAVRPSAGRAAGMRAPASVKLTSLNSVALTLRKARPGLQHDALIT